MEPGRTLRAGRASCGAWTIAEALAGWGIHGDCPGGTPNGICSCPDSKPSFAAANGFSPWSARSLPCICLNGGWGKEDEFAATNAIRSAECCCAKNVFGVAKPWGGKFTSCCGTPPGVDGNISSSTRRSTTMSKRMNSASSRDINPARNRRHGEKQSETVWYLQRLAWSARRKTKAVGKGGNGRDGGG